MHAHIECFEEGAALAGRALYPQRNPAWSEPMAMRIVHLPWAICSFASLATTMDSDPHLLLTRSDGQWMFPGQLDCFRFMADHETFALTQRVCHRLQTDLDLQHLPLDWEAFLDQQ